MGISKFFKNFFKNYRSKKSLLEENRRLFRENMELKTQYKINHDIHDYVEYEIKTFKSQMIFSDMDCMNVNLTDKLKRCLIAKDFLEIMEENLDMSEEVGIDGALYVRAKLRLAVKK